MDWSLLAEDRGKWQAVVSVVIGWLVSQLVVFKIFDYRYQNPLKCDAIYLQGLFICP